MTDNRYRLLTHEEIEGIREAAVAAERKSIATAILELPWDYSSESAERGGEESMRDRVLELLERRVEDKR